MNILNESQWFGVVRHLLSAVGGFAVYKGLVSEDEASSVIGAALSLLAVIWSVTSKDKNI